VKKIGIVGRGFVGAAVAHGFSSAVGYDAEVRVYDKEPKKSLNTLEEVVNESEVIFISVPTPSNTEGSINLDMIYDCLESINMLVDKARNNPVLLVRSTVVPGTTRKLQSQYPNLNLVFNPEFLTERSANFDFISQTRVILGGDKGLTAKVADIYRDRFGETIKILETDYESAELIKYTCNTYFATKVSFLNEIRLISDKVNANWEDVVSGFLSDGRIGNSHTQVPGPDGKFGFGGSCFPKDVQALISFAEDLGLTPNVLKGAWNTNLEVRPEKDWEHLKGRAVVDDKI
tara:strand:+ start:132 stop:998 length:867 start_codon:yes stop_codon:yes gene_type:complete